MTMKLTLINADTDKDIAEFKDGYAIYLSEGKNLNVRADPAPGTTSVQFGLDGNANYRLEKTAPYALAGNSGANYAPWTPSIGAHKITATSYPNKESVVVNFTVVAVKPAPEPPPAPPPTVDANWFVSPTGDDAAAGTPDKPFKTLARAVGVAQAGHKILLRDGTYPGYVKLKDGLVILGENPRKAIIDGGGIETVLEGGQHVVLQGLDICNCNGMLQHAHAAVKVGTGVRIRNCVFRDITHSGLAYSGEDHITEDTIFTHCGQQGHVTNFTKNTVFRRCKWIENNHGVKSPKWAGYKLNPYLTTYQDNAGLWHVDPDFEAGAMKDWSSVNSIYEDCESYGNTGPGFWMDYHNNGARYLRCYSHDNKGRDAQRYYQGEGWRCELSGPPNGNCEITDCKAERNSGAAITFITWNGAKVNNFEAAGNRFVYLLRCDDSRGNLSNITTNNTKAAPPLYTIWGSNPRTNVVIDGKPV